MNLIFSATGICQPVRSCSTELQQCCEMIHCCAFLSGSAEGCRPLCAADELSGWLQVAGQHAVAQSLVDFKRARDLAVARRVVATLRQERQDAAEAANEVSTCDQAPPDTAAV